MDSSSPEGVAGNGTKGTSMTGRVRTFHWDELPIALADGTRVRTVTAAAARAHLRAGMTVAEARSRCAALRLLPWDDVAVADEIRRATAAFLAASPLVTPVAGAPGLWWIGASGLEALGGEPALAQALWRLTRHWHPRARVSIADSCVAARAGTWDRSGERRATPGPGTKPAGNDEREGTHHASGIPHPDGIVIVPPGGDRAYLASVPLGLIPMEEDIRETLKALGIETAGAFATFAADDVERRWGSLGLAAWRLARGEDRRRPVLARTDAPRSASAELTPSVTAIEAVLFLVRAALDRLVRDLVADSRAAATVAITLTLDDARGALPGGSAAHTITREVRFARPLARTAPLLERCRALLDRWTLSAPVCGVTVAITATAPLTGEQGDLLDVAWRDPAAADAAFARLRAELGPNAVVFPVARDEHRPERAGTWVEDITETTGQPLNCAEPRVATHKSRITPAIRQLEIPELVDVECEEGVPRVLWWRGRRVRLAHTVGPERLSGDWWKDGYARDYWQCEEAEGEGDLVIYHDGSSAAGGWYLQGWYD
jgi:protein ImuB